MLTHFSGQLLVLTYYLRDPRVVPALLTTGSTSCMSIEKWTALFSGYAELTWPVHGLVTEREHRERYQLDLLVAYWVTE